MNTIKEIFQIFVGGYSPITYTDSTGISIIPSGFAGVDFQWIFSAVLIIIGVYSIFRIIGIIISKF